MSSGATDPIPLLDLKRLHAPLAAELRAAFDNVLESGQFIGGAALARFEAALSDHTGVAHCVGVSSGTDALLAALMALGVGPGDEVITTAYSFFATAGSIVRAGATPVFVDIDPLTYTISPDAVAAALTPRTAGIVPVHLFGQCAEMAPISALAETHGLFVLEDAAQAIGAMYKGCFAGNLGTAGGFSFFPAKNLGALGDGGAVVTNDGAFAASVRALSRHGADLPYRHNAVGGNFRLDALQAAFLSVKLPYLRTWEAGRRRVAAAYADALSEVPSVTLPYVAKGRLSVFNQFVIRSRLRDRIKAALDAAEIGNAVYYPVPLHQQPCFAHLDYKAGVLPESERASEETLAIPVDPLLSEKEVRRVCDVIKQTVLHGRERISVR